MRCRPPRAGVGVSGFRRSPASAALDPAPDGSIVVADLDTSVIHHIDRTGAAIWSAVGQGRELAAIVVAAAAALGVDPTPAFEDACRDFLAQLEARGLLFPHPHHT